MIPCDDCEATWSAYGEGPPCGGSRDLAACDQITEPLHEDNAAAWALFDLVRDQHVMGPQGPASMSLVAACHGCDLLAIPDSDRLQMIYRVRAAYHAAVAALVKKRTGGKG